MRTTEQSRQKLHDSIVARQRIAEFPLLEMHEPEFLRQTLFDLVRMQRQQEEGMQPLGFLEEVADFAENAFTEKYRIKGTRNGEKIPDVVHAYRVAIRLAEAGIVDDTTLATALLHDVVEDTKEDAKITPEAIADLFGEEIAINVVLLSKNINEGPKLPIEKYYENMRPAPLAVRRVKYADRIDNLSSFLVMPLDDEMKPGKLVAESFLRNLDETEAYYPDINPENDHLTLMLGRAVDRGRRRFIRVEESIYRRSQQERKVG